MQLLETYQIDNSHPNLEQWKQKAYHSFIDKMTNKQHKFPCIPATQGFHLEQLRYSFVGDPTSEETFGEIASLLKEYGSNYRKFGHYTSLIVFFHPSYQKSSSTVLDFEKQFWCIVNEVSKLDDTKWPEEIPLNASDPLWEFCFEGERYFVYCATPSHKNRQSRYFPNLMLAITPREVFSQFETLPYSNHIKSKIRDRIKEYDSLEPHPDLKSYGDQNNYEAKQYFLRDDQSSMSGCPFHKHIDKKG
ncbi:YqcI/YcgG family protein [Aquibacillus kalidii]|uniref:YqcI/YcgG family protein n=1 Tax=Aquibacillus kalidii TaxID=2762597 RepID=UPI002E2D4FF3|nr:YqcI/YcgG family protein [Aquibacillus kalidii]